MTNGTVKWFHSHLLILLGTLTAREVASSQVIGGFLAGKITTLSKLCKSTGIDGPRKRVRPTTNFLLLRCGCAKRWGGDSILVCILLQSSLHGRHQL